MKVTLTFDLNRVGSAKERPILASYFRGEITIEAATLALGWTPDQWKTVFWLLFMLAVGNKRPAYVIDVQSTEGTIRGHRHGEAFCRMKYRCNDCGRVEWLWNSRDGVTPFGISCAFCRGTAGMYHVDWQEDEFRPDYTPVAGERFFRDGTQDEARAYIRQRLERAKGTEWAAPEAEWPEIVESTATAIDGEFQPGWSQIETAT
jgi:hypothetical protein